MGRTSKAHQGALTDTPQTAQTKGIKHFFPAGDLTPCTSLGRKMASAPTAPSRQLPTASGSGASGSRSPISSPVLPIMEVPSQTPPLLLTQTPEPSASELRDEWQACMCTLPIQSNMEAFVLHLEEGYREEVRSLRADIQSIQARTKTLETSQTALQAASSQHDKQLEAHEEKLHTLFLLHDDLENRNRRNNIHLRALPEATGDEDLLPTVKGILSRILRAPEDLDLEIDGAHRALGPRNTDPSRPRDVICVYTFTAQKRTSWLKCAHTSFPGF